MKTTCNGLSVLAKDSTVTALRLDPLTPTDIENILRESLGCK